MNERFKFPADREARNAARTKALESLLIEKGVITGETVDKVLGVFETKMGPVNGARLVARAWVDPAFKERATARAILLPIRLNSRPTSNLLRSCGSMIFLSFASHRDGTSSQSGNPL